MSFFVITICYGEERTIGCAWLTIPVGTREAALGGTGTAISLGPAGIYYNPAATVQHAPFSAHIEYTKWFLDIHHQALFISRDLNYFTIGLGVVSFSSGRFEYREEIPLEEPLGTFSPLDFSGYLNIARPLARWANIGITARYYYSKVMSNQLVGSGIDIGARFHPLKNLSTGMAVLNFGRTMSYKYQLIWLPASVRGGVAYTLPIGQNNLLLVFDGSWFFYSNKANLQFGTEFLLGNIISLRVGYDLLNPANHINFGLGITVKRFQFDYTFVPINFGLGLSHRIGISYTPSALNLVH
ncbi:MAG: PorV/PorQ family protein [bacterium]